MSKAIDPHYMSEDDVEYVRQRPNLRREFILQGFGDPLEEDYPGLISNQDVDEEEPDGSGDDSNPDNPDGSDSGSEPEGSSGSDGDDGDGEEDEDEDEEPITLDESEQWEPEMKNAELATVISRRNEGRDPESDWFIQPEGDKKGQMIAALEADDQRIAEYNESLNSEE